ncbi:hypothetical protein SBV1_2030005 [Verrucomicrobia bacterium]|nr:hypothetical protein SBV1_2030005 [Verrucomicrobiota bacterium]
MGYELERRSVSSLSSANSNDGSQTISHERPQQAGPSGEGTRTCMAGGMGAGESCLGANYLHRIQAHLGLRRITNWVASPPPEDTTSHPSCAAC